MRREYRRRRDHLLAELRRQLPGARISGLAAGLHLMVQLPEGIDAASLTGAACRLGLGLAPLERYTLGEMAGPQRSLVIGYGNVSLSAIGEAVHRLAQAIQITRR